MREIVHHAALSYSDVPAFMTALRTQKGVAARALEFVVLTVPRTGEHHLIKNHRPPMRWSHVDFDNATWTIPKTKTDTEHEVPLPAAALDLLKEIRKQNLDCPRHRLSRSTWACTAPRCHAQGARRHGRAVRRTDGARHSRHFQSPAGYCTSFAREVIEACLAHAISDKLEAAYRRTSFFQKRPRLMQAWAGYCTKLTTTTKSVVAAPA